MAALAGSATATLAGPARAVPLFGLGDVTAVRTPDEQFRENLQPAIFVTAELNEDEAGLGSVVTDVQGWMSSEVTMPAGYRWEIGGHYLRMREAFRSLLVVMVVAILLVFIMLAFQALMMFAAIPVVSSGSAALLVLVATFIGFNYGSNLALFPSFAKDYWGFKNYGLNYGVLFTAWGVGGFVMGRVSEMMAALPGGLNKSFILAGSLLTVGTVLTFFLREKKAVEVKAPVIIGEPAAVLEESR